MAYRFKTFSDLPQEMCDEIVDVGHKSPHYLKSCALVHRSLRHRAQGHLFKSVNLSTFDRVVRLVEIVENNSQVAQYISDIRITFAGAVREEEIDTSLAFLLKLIKQSSPAYPSFPKLSIIQDLPDKHFPDEPYKCRITFRETTQCLVGVTHLCLKDVLDFPAVLLRRFKKLTNLTVINSHFDLPLYSLDRPKCSESLPSITDIHIEHTDQFPSFLISCCPELKNLSIDRVTFYPPQIEAASSVFPYFPKITHLKFSRCNVATILALGQSVVDLSRLRCVSNVVDGSCNEKQTEEEIQCRDHIMQLTRVSLQDV
ncbi:hypothetical protein HYPSUDRAFT_200102 [Hypholoma sublateritium FD-334 SS-4]|uniref:F-box domain-containing protein n=1 Tax=Hypholoma sublateritium (strain FD-334 SS-4) TaxID=945553 RepID=A0A0D2LC59_HYPSF|nr:hypothetical protein HYPSUDRAFT_200102 [Hypholoma sublateritium FD-334 SS-4]